MADKYLTLLTLALGLLSPVAEAHGFVQGIVAEGIFYQGYRPSFQYLSEPPKVAGWSDPKNLDNGYINNYTSPDIICNLGATPGQASVTVKAGDTVELEWTPWPSAHLGPVLGYLANCNGDCSTVDKTKLLFNKISEEGLISDATVPGIWGASELIRNNNSWTVTIPPSVAPGQYVLRNEIIALMQAQTLGGAQNYPMCVNLLVTGSGTDSLQTGTLGTELYSQNDPGLHIDIYQPLSNYTIPGPALYAGAVNSPQPGQNLTEATLFANSTTITSGISSSTSTTTSLSSSTTSGAVTTTSMTTSELSSTSTTSGFASLALPNVVVITSTIIAAAATTTGLSSSTTSGAFTSTSTTTGLSSSTTSGDVTTTSMTTSEFSSTSTTSGFASLALPNVVVITSTIIAAAATTFQTSTVSNSVTAAVPSGSSFDFVATDVLTLTLTVPGVFADPVALPTPNSLGFYPLRDGIDEAWDTSRVWPTGTRAACGTGMWTGPAHLATGARFTGCLQPFSMPTAFPVDNGSKPRRSFRFARWNS